MTALLVSHVLISLVAIVSGVFVTYSFIAGKRHESWMSVFLVTTIATSVTGFLFPVNRITPGHIVGLISLAVLAVAVATRNLERHVGAWSRTHIGTVLFSFYLNAFVLVVQLFQKIPDLRLLAPTQSEAPFVAAQVGLMLLFVVLGVASIRRNRVAELNGIHRVLEFVSN